MTDKTETAPGGEYTALLDELGVFAKATKDAEVIAKGGDAGEGEEDEDAEGADSGDEGGGEGGDMAKSMTVVLPDGTSVEAFDGTAMVKALGAKLSGAYDRIDVLIANGGALLKGLTVASEGMTSLRVVVATQDQAIKSLQAEIAIIGGKGAGRRSALTIHDKVPGGAAPQKEGITPTELMAKAMAAFEAGHIPGSVVNRLEAYSHHPGTPIPTDIVSAVMSAPNSAR